MKSRFATTFILLLLVIRISIAQESEPKILTAYLTESVSENEVKFGAIKNEKTGEVTLTNADGYFQISGTVGDTLRFHSLGYKDTTWIVPTVWVNMEETIQLKVKSNIYSLSEVEVLRYRSYAHFKQAFKDLRVDKTEAEKAKETVGTWGPQFEEALAWGKALKKEKSGTFGVSFSAGGIGKLEKQKKEVERLEKVYEKSARFNYFISRDNMLQLTDYKGTCLDSFMVFLNSGYNLHYKMDEYQLLESILQASNDFKVKYGEKDWYSQPID